MENTTKIEINDVRSEDDLIKALMLSERFLYKNYLDDIGHLPVKPILENNEDIFNELRILKLKKFVYSDKEKDIEKMTSVLTALNSIGCTYGYIINSDGKEVNIYYIVKSLRNTALGKDTLFNGLKGNFPGIEIENVFSNEIQDLIEEQLFKYEKINSISSAVVVPREKKDNLEVNIQGIEKFIDSMLGEQYTAVFISKFLDSNTIKGIRNSLEDVYTLLSPFKETDFSFNENESEAVSKSLSKGITESVTDTVTKTNGTSNTVTKTDTVGGSVSVGITGETGVNLGFFKAGSKVSTTVSANYSHAVAKGKTTTESTSNSTGKQKGTSENTTHGNTITVGESRNYSFKSENKNIMALLERVDNMLKRIAASEDIGMCRFGAYFLCMSEDIALRAASTYTGIVKGEASGLENNFINIWNKGNENYINIINNLKAIEHPIIVDKNKMEITPTTVISCRELAFGTGFPYKSVPGVPSMMFTPFARNICTYDESKGKKIDLGNIFHMGALENRRVEIDLNDLTMHTFITGSTGSGKTNATCKLISEVVDKGVKVLIIEPAKGEYKDFFGEENSFKVYGSNPLISDVLKINPFSFPKNIHVLEHIDRLIEIFSACWPLYAAMPAILKEAVEISYERVGWNLEYSINAAEEFPTFDILLEVLPEIITKSAYSEELKSNYIGSLVTRVKSLTTGLVGNIFKGNEISSEELFNSNVIIDLSRIGALETKSLIMGVVFLKLYEERLNSSNFTSELKHLTVIEEAHNLLKKSNQGSSEGSNIQQKSVEMISNGIAEMRAFGEGFVIVDQAPMSLDESAIRNTNTKIALRLPDESDRRLVGKSALLTEEQIFEVSRLRKGVGVIFQNNWLEPVLCKIDKFDGKAIFKPEIKEYKEIINSKKRLLELLLSKASGEKEILSLKEGEELKKYVNENISKLDIRNTILETLDSLMEGKKPAIFKDNNELKISKLVYEIVNGKSFERVINFSETIEDLDRELFMQIQEVFNLDYIYTMDLIRHLLVYNAYEGESAEKSILNGWLNLLQGRGIV